MLSKRSLLLTIFGLLTSCADQARIGTVLTLTGDPVNGQSVYTNLCEECHGDALQGTQKGPSLKNVVPRSDDDEILLAVLRGPDEMPSFDDLTDQELSDVLVFLRQAAP